MCGRLRWRLLVWLFVLLQLRLNEAHCLHFTRFDRGTIRLLIVGGIGPQH